MIAFLTHLLWAAVAALCVARADRAFAAWLKAAYVPPVDPDHSPAVVVPADLIAWAAEESETWAQEERMALCREKFTALADWNRVRQAVGIGVME
ncbi:MAG: hypothetical protein ACYC3F_17085 [Gemmatimonadaceae bacterium]